MIWACPAAVFGHGVGFRTIDDPGALVVEFYYSTGEPMAYAQVLVWSPEDDKVEFQNGRTDKNGRFAFAPTQNGAWRVEASDGRGHKAVAQCPVEKGTSEKPAPASAPGPAGVPGSKTIKFILSISLLANLTLALLLFARKKRARPLSPAADAQKKNPEQSGGGQRLVRTNPPEIIHPSKTRFLTFPKGPPKPASPHPPGSHPTSRGLSAASP